MKFVKYEKYLAWENYTTKHLKFRSGKEQWRIPSNTMKIDAKIKHTECKKKII